MNILIDKLPDTYEGLKLNTDFRTSILFEIMMQDNTVSKNDKIAMAMQLYYGRYPKDYKELETMKDGICWFYARSKKIQKQEKVIKREKEKKLIYSFEYDDEMIYSAFLEQYGIDLNTEDIHWWKFKALFNSLKEDTMIVKAMQYRSINLADIKDEKQRKKYAKLQKMYALPDNRSEEEKEQDFANSLW